MSACAVPEGARMRHTPHAPWPPVQADGGNARRNLLPRSQDAVILGSKGREGDSPFKRVRQRPFLLEQPLQSRACPPSHPSMHAISCMLACMHVCGMHVCMHVCMHECMYAAPALECMQPRLARLSGQGVQGARRHERCNKWDGRLSLRRRGAAAAPP